MHEDDVPEFGQNQIRLSNYGLGYRANIVTYAMAKVFHDAISDKQVLDVDAIWRRQAVPDALLRALLVAAAEANDVITHPPAGVRNMSEWAKQQACWNGLKGRKLEYDDDFASCLTLIESVRTAVRDARAKKALTEGINAQTEAVNLGADFWQKVMDWGKAERKKLSPTDLRILQICASMPRRIPRDFEAKHAMELLQKMKDQGFDDR